MADNQTAKTYHAIAFGAAPGRNGFMLAMAMSITLWGGIICGVASFLINVLCQRVTGKSMLLRAISRASSNTTTQAQKDNNKNKNTVRSSQRASVQPDPVLQKRESAYGAYMDLMKQANENDGDTGVRDSFGTTARDTIGSHSTAGRDSRATGSRDSQATGGRDSRVTSVRDSRGSAATASVDSLGMRKSTARDMGATNVENVGARTSTDTSGRESRSASGRDSRGTARSSTESTMTGRSRGSQRTMATVKSRQTENSRQSAGTRSSYDGIGGIGGGMGGGPGMGRGGAGAWQRQDSVDSSHKSVRSSVTSAGTRQTNPSMHNSLTQDASIHMGMPGSSGPNIPRNSNRQTTIAGSGISEIPENASNASDPYYGNANNDYYNI